MSSIAAAVIVWWLYLLFADEIKVGREIRRIERKIRKEIEERERMRKFLREHSVVPQTRIVRTIDEGILDSVSIVAEGEFSMCMRDVKMKEHLERMIPSERMTEQGFQLMASHIKKPFTFTYHERHGLVDVYYEPLQWKRI